MALSSAGRSVGGSSTNSFKLYDTCQAIKMTKATTVAAATTTTTTISGKKKRSVLMETALDGNGDELVTWILFFSRSIGQL